MFSCNSALVVTEKTLILAEMKDFRTLLEHANMGTGLITERMIRLSLDKYNSREGDVEFLEVLFDFEPSTIVPSDLAQQFLRLRSLSTIELLYQHDSALRYSEDTISTFIGWEDRRSRSNGHPHSNLLEALERYPDQWTPSIELEKIVDQSLPRLSDQNFKGRWYVAAGWQSDNNPNTLATSSQQPGRTFASTTSFIHPDVVGLSQMHCESDDRDE